MPSRTSQMSAEFAELVLDASPMVAMVRDATGELPIVYVSEAVRQFGYDAATLIRKRTGFRELLHPTDRESVIWGLRTALEGGSDNFTDSYRLQTGFGETRWVSDWTSISRDGKGRPLHTTTLLLDTTRQHESEQSFEDVSSSIPGALFQYRLFPNGTDRLEYFNTRCSEIWEYDMSQLDNDPGLLWDAIVEEDFDGIQASVMASFQSLELWEQEYRIRTPSGKLKWLRARGTPRQLPDGSVRWHTIIMDVSIEKQNAQASGQGLTAAIQALTKVVEARDPQVVGHHYRVAHISAAIGEALGFEAERIECLRLAGSVHDIGELVVPVELLNKPGPFTASEFERVQGHAEAGAAILEEISGRWPLADIVRQHHERCDGTGYPRGLERDDILPEARIIAVAEVVDAMHHVRPYREALTREQVISELTEGRGRAYDASVADAALQLFEARAFDEILLKTA